MGAIVAARESIYVLLTIVCAFVNPVFLLLDTVCQWHEDKISFFIYVIAPEKFVWICLAGESFACIFLLGIFLLSCLDLVGLAALVVACTSGTAHLALLIGYVVTTMGGLFTIVVVVSQNVCS